MGSYRIGSGYRAARRRVRRMRRAYRDFRASVRDVLRGSLMLRLAVYAVLLVVAAGAVIHMADVNAAVRPQRDMKWYMHPDAVQVAAPPMAQESFGEADAEAAPEEPGAVEEDRTPAEGENLAAGILSLFASAKAEELPADAVDEPDGEADPGEPEGLDDPDEAEGQPAAGDARADASSGDVQADAEEGFTAVPMVIWDEAETVDASPKATGAPAAKGKVVELTISAAGDCTLGGDVRTGGHTRFDKYVRKNGYAYFLSKVKSAFAKDDITIVNLEGPLTNRTKPRVRKMYTFRGKPAYAKILKAGSVEVCNIANNHALDFDTDGLKETVRALDAAGIGSCGFGKVCFKKVKGVKVGFMGFTKWQYSAKEIYRAVKAQRKKCDLMIVSIHWGDEGVYKASKEQRLMGRAAILGGADLVVGHHPHVFGGIEKYKGKYIVYSLSNFCFGGNRNPSDKRTFIFQQTFRITSKGVKDGGINILPCAVTLSRKGNDYRPAPMPKDRALLLLKNIAKYSYIKFNKVKWMDGAYPVRAGLVKKK